MREEVGQHLETKIVNKSLQASDILQNVWWGVGPSSRMYFQSNGL